MSLEQLTVEAIALPLAERVALAQALWSSLQNGAVEQDEAESIEQACARDAEFTSGHVEGKSHHQVMETVRHALQ